MNVMGELYGSIGNQSYDGQAPSMLEGKEIIPLFVGNRVNENE